MKTTGLCIAVGLWASVAPVSAAVVTFQNGVDGYTGNQGRTTTSFGGGTTIFDDYGASLGGAGRFIAPIRFNSLSFPGGLQSVESISLSLTVSSNTLNGSGSVGLAFNNRGANSGWVEGQVTQNIIKTGTSWTGPAGTLSSAGSGVAPLSGSGAWDIGAANNGLPLMANAAVSGTTNAVDSVLTLTFTGLSAADRLKLIQIWSFDYSLGSQVVGGQTYTANPGMFFSFNSTSTYSSGDIRFNGDSASVVAKRPILTIQYTPIPEPTAAMLLPLAMGVTATRRRRA